MARKTLEEIKQERRERAELLKKTDLQDVCEALGGDPEKIGKNGEIRWKFGAKGSRTHRIGVDEAAGIWGCVISHKGGKGAFDLVMEIKRCNFNEAFAWLDSKFGPGVEREVRKDLPARAEIAPAGPKELVMPAADPAAWPGIRRHLIETRGLSARIVDAAHEQGDLYATSRVLDSGKKISNVVMVMRDETGAVKGAEIKGTFKPEGQRRFSALAPGSNKDNGSFIVGDPLPKAEVVMAVESGIDAMAALDHLRQVFPHEKIAVISSAGDGHIPVGIHASIPLEAQVFGGQDRDAQGETMFGRLMADWVRYEPPGPGKDWGDWAEGQLARIRAGEIIREEDLDAAESNAWARQQISARNRSLEAARTPTLETSYSKGRI